eukprot:15457415-Alexandrium_andersonii.AAC.1
MWPDACSRGGGSELGGRTAGRAGCARGRSRGARKALLIDVREVRLQAYAEDDIYVVLPPEVSEPG